MLDDTLAQSFPNARSDDLRKLISAMLDVFRTDCSQSAAKNPPLKLKFKPHSKPIHVKIRKYSDRQRTVLRKLVRELLDAGLVYTNPT